MHIYVIMSPPHKGVCSFLKGAPLALRTRQKVRQFIDVRLF